MSGITCTDECVAEFNKFKLQGTSKDARAYLIFRIVKEEIQLTDSAPAGTSWSDFLEALTKDESDGAYGIYDYKVETDDGRQLAKIIFVAWTPDNGLPIKKKMLYGSTREGFKSALGSGIAYVIQATDIADLDEDEISEMVKKGR